MNGNVTREGITRDPEWMQRVGLGDTAIYQVAYVSSPGHAGYLSEYWQERIRHAISEAARSTNKVQPGIPQSTRASCTSLSLPTAASRLKNGNLPPE